MTRYRALDTLGAEHQYDPSLPFADQPDYVQRELLKLPAHQDIGLSASKHEKLHSSVPRGRMYRKMFGLDQDPNFPVSNRGKF